MKNINSFIIVAGLILLLIAVIGAGCEEESGGNVITIEDINCNMEDNQLVNCMTYTDCQNYCAESCPAHGWGPLQKTIFEPAKIMTSATFLPARCECVCEK